MLERYSYYLLFSVQDFSSVALFSVYEVPEVGVLLSFVPDVMQPNQWSNPGTSQNHSPSPGWLKVKGLVLHQRCTVLTKICCREHMFLSSLQIYLCLVHIKTSL